MFDYIEIDGISQDSQDFINKSIERFLNISGDKRLVEDSYYRQIEYSQIGKNHLYSLTSLKSAFSAKDFWKNYHECGSFLVFHDYYKKNETKLHLANFCKRDRLCPACAVRRAYKQQNKFLDIYEKLEDKTSDWYYIVLPVRHTAKEPFEVVFDRINRLKSMISKSIRNRKMNNFFSDFLGGMYSIETTRTANGWNVHLNILINAKNGSKIDLKQVINRRGQISYQNDKLGLFMRQYADDSLMHNIQKLDFSTPDSLRGALVEVLKYSLKFSSLTKQDLIQFFVKTKGKRLFGTFGHLWGLGLEDVDLNQDDVIDNEFLEIMLRRISGSYELFSFKKIFKSDPEKISQKVVRQTL